MSERPEGQPDDQTRPLPPAANGPDETAPLGRTPEAAGPDETAPLGRTPEAAGPDETAPLGRTPGSAGPDETAPLPPAQRSRPAAWSGRAEVPSRASGDDRELAGGEWYGEEPGGRRWWLPILWGIVLLLVLGLFGAGLWLARQALDEDAPNPPQPTASATPTASASPTTSSPEPSPTTSATPAALPMPPVVGLSEAAARAALDRLGLDYQVRYRPSEQPAGTVIATEPAAGELVRVGDEVTLVVATASPSPSPTTGTPTTGTPTAEPTTEPTGTSTPTATPTG
ncbi:PASTA domain-containing protein [Micromonospora radicis]|uniref:PASTA domain-containing protein n=1 Tax=Micromonospora radicis TaxID=1894971 RepID=A0A418MWQ0_9ACTN|nr:PASTA domain-containing protein [Micromonospora radicis]RIV38987.1 PASTA domain-containing protein [Micromonospora radicis]